MCMCNRISTVRWAPTWRSACFIGYPTDYKGWKFYNPATKKTVISERAVFDERYFPGLKNGSSIPPLSAHPITSNDACLNPSGSASPPSTSSADDDVYIPPDVASAPDAPHHHHRGERIPAVQLEHVEPLPPQDPPQELHASLPHTPSPPLAPEHGVPAPAPVLGPSTSRQRRTRSTARSEQQSVRSGSRSHSLLGLVLQLRFVIHSESAGLLVNGGRFPLRLVLLSHSQCMSLLL